MYEYTLQEIYKGFTQDLFSNLYVKHDKKYFVVLT